MGESNLLDDTVAELERLYAERDRLSFLEQKTPIRKQRLREHRERVDRLIARIESGRE